MDDASAALEARLAAAELDRNLLGAQLTKATTLQRKTTTRADAGPDDDASFADPARIAERGLETASRLREAETEVLQLMTKLQRAETEIARKNKAIEELLDASGRNAGADGGSLRREQALLVARLRSRVAALEGALAERGARAVELEVALPAALAAEAAAERAALAAEVARLRAAS